MINYLRLSNIYFQSIYLYLLILFLCGFMLFSRDHSVHIIVILSSFCFLMTLLPLCQMIMLSAKSYYVRMVPKLEGNIVSMCRQILILVLICVLSIASLANKDAIILIAWFWFGTCVLFFVYLRYLKIYPLILFSSAFIGVGISVASNEIWSVVVSASNYISALFVVAGTSILFMGKKVGLCDERPEGIVYWFFEFFPMYNNGRFAGTGFPVPNFMVRMFFPFSALNSTSLSSLLSSVIVIVIVLTLLQAIAPLGPVNNAVLFLMFSASACGSAVLGKAGQPYLSIVDYQIVSLLPRYRSRGTFIHRLSISHMTYMVVSWALVLLAFLFGTGFNLHFSFLQWVCCVVIPFSVAAYSYLFYSISSYYTKIITVFLYSAFCILILLVVLFFFDPLVDVFLVFSLFLMQSLWCFVLGRRRLITMDWT